MIELMNVFLMLFNVALLITFAIFRNIVTHMGNDDDCGPKKIVIDVKRLYKSSLIPTKGTSGAAGYDLYSNESVSIEPGRFACVSTGISVAFSDKQIYGKIEGRSGLCLRNGIRVGAGVIDNDYRGEIKVMLFNDGSESFVICPGDRIAQIIYHSIPETEQNEVEIHNTTARGFNGFGSTGTN